MNFLEEFALTTIDHVALLFEEHPYEELINILREADDDYTNGIESDLSDANMMQLDAKQKYVNHITYILLVLVVKFEVVKLNFLTQWGA